MIKETKIAIQIFIFWYSLFIDDETSNFIMKSYLYFIIFFFEQEGQKLLSWKHWKGKNLVI